MPECVPGQAHSQRLLAGDHVKLTFQDLEERNLVESHRWSHDDIMPTASDKQSVRKPIHTVRKRGKSRNFREPALSGARSPGGTM